MGTPTRSQGLLQRLHANPVFRQRGAMATREVDNRGTLYVASAGDMNSASRLLEELQNTEGVVEPFIAPDRDVLHGRGHIPTVDQWHAQVELQAARSLPQWTSGTHEVSVAVVDSGCDCNHPQLGAFTYLDHLSTASAPADGSGHGSHVSGLIGALFSNTNQFGGVADGPVRITMHRGLTRPHDVAGYYRALRAAQSAAIINLSTGGEGEDPVETELIADAIEAGAVVVAAMGNHAEVGNPDIYPAMLPDVIAVGAVDGTGQRASFSNTGNHIFIGAPGVGILSTVPLYALNDVFPTGNPPLAAFDGTSMATPIVAGAIARMLAYQPTLTRPQILDLLERSCAGPWNDEIGHGVLNIRKLLSLL